MNRPKPLTRLKQSMQSVINKVLDAISVKDSPKYSPAFGEKEFRIAIPPSRSVESVGAFGVSAFRRIFKRNLQMTEKDYRKTGVGRAKPWAKRSNTVMEVAS